MAPANKPTPLKILPRSYFGGKESEGTYQTLINHIPPHDVFISGFLGHCAIMRYKRFADFNLGLEINPDIVNAWDSEGPENVTVLEVDTLAWLDTEFDSNGLTMEKTTFLYLDPPYLHSTRKSRHRYPYEFTDEQHVRLLELADSLPCMVGISCYDSELYASMLQPPKWRKIQFQSQTRKGPATETFYMNYPEPTELHDYRYLGTDYRERERIRKKVKRHVRRLQDLPELERKAIITELSKI